MAGCLQSGQLAGKAGVSLPGASRDGDSVAIPVVGFLISLTMAAKWRLRGLIFEPESQCAWV